MSAVVEDVRRRARMALISRAGRGKTTDVNPRARSVSVEKAGWWSRRLGVPVAPGTPTAALPKSSQIDDVLSLEPRQREAYLRLRAAGGTHERALRDARELRPAKKATNAPAKKATSATARTAAQKRAVAEAAIETLASDLRQIPEARRGPAAEASRYLDRLRSGDLDVDNVWDVLRHMLSMHQFNRRGDVAGLPEHEDPEWHQRAEVAIKKAIDRLREAGMDPHSRAAKKAAKAAPRKATQSAEQRRRQVEDFARRYQRGESISQIAAAEGVSYSTVHSMLTKEAGIQLRPRGGRKATPAKKAAPAKATPARERESAQRWSVDDLTPDQRRDLFNLTDEGRRVYERRRDAGASHAAAFREAEQITPRQPGEASAREMFARLERQWGYRPSNEQVLARLSNEELRRLTFNHDERESLGISADDVAREQRRRGEGGGPIRDFTLDAFEASREGRAAPRPREGEGATVTPLPRRATASRRTEGSAQVTDLSDYRRGIDAGLSPRDAAAFAAWARRNPGRSVAEWEGMRAREAEAARPPSFDPIEVAERITGPDAQRLSRDEIVSRLDGLNARQLRRVATALNQRLPDRPPDGGNWTRAALARFIADNIIEGRARWSLGGRRPTTPSAGAPTVESLRAMQTREQVREALAGLRKSQLQALARELSVPGVASKNMQELRDEIVQATVGRRLESLAIRGFEGDRP